MTTKNQNETEEDETTIQVVKPSWKSYVGWIIIGLITIGASGLGIAILILVWLRMKYDSYTITTERLISKRGIIARKLDEIELFRIKDVVVTQGIIERLVGVGTVEVLSVDNTTPKLYIRGINKPLETKEMLRKLYKNSRKKERVINTELMFSQ